MFAFVLLKHTHAIRVVSERIKQSLVVRGIHAEKITVLPIRPELEAFLKMEHTVRENPPYTFLYVGRLASEKDIPRIVEAFAVVHKKNPDVRLRIVGEGPEKKRIEKLIQRLGCIGVITIAPWTEDIPREMVQADIFLLASRHEAYALTLIEAMAVGLPIVTTDVGCVGEVMRDGVHGLVVHEEGILPYAQKMEHLMMDTVFRKSCSREGRATGEKLALVTPEEYARTWVRTILQK